MSLSESLQSLLLRLLLLRGLWKWSLSQLEPLSGAAAGDTVIRGVAEVGFAGEEAAEAVVRVVPAVAPSLRDGDGVRVWMSFSSCQTRGQNRQSLVLGF